MQEAESIGSTLGENELDELEKCDALFDEDVLVMARVRVRSTSELRTVYTTPSGQQLGSVVSRGVEKKLGQRRCIKFLYSLVDTNEHTLLDFCRCGQGRQSETMVFLPGTQDVVAKIVKEERDAEMLYRLSNQREAQMCDNSLFKLVKARAKDPIHVFRREDNQVVATAENYYTNYSWFQKNILERPIPHLIHFANKSPTMPLMIPTKLKKNAILSLQPLKSIHAHTPDIQTKIAPCWETRGSILIAMFIAERMSKHHLPTEDCYVTMQEGNDLMDSRATFAAPAIASF